MVEPLTGKSRINRHFVVACIYDCYIAFYTNRTQGRFHIIAQGFTISIFFLVSKFCREWFEPTDAKLYAYISKIFLQVIIYQPYFFFIVLRIFNQIDKKTFTTY